MDYIHNLLIQMTRSCLRAVKTLRVYKANRHLQPHCRSLVLIFNPAIFKSSSTGDQESALHATIPVKGLKVSTSNVCLPILDRSTFSSGQMWYSCRLLLMSNILFVMPSGAGPGDKAKGWWKDLILMDTLRQFNNDASIKQNLALEMTPCTVHFSTMLAVLQSSWKPLCLLAHATTEAYYTAQSSLYSPPLEMLYLMPKSPLGPPGLWLAVRIIPPTAFILRITQETAGVDMMPFWPITRWPIWRREYKYTGVHGLIRTWTD